MSIIDSLNPAINYLTTFQSAPNSSKISKAVGRGLASYQTALPSRVTSSKLLLAEKFLTDIQQICQRSYLFSPLWIHERVNTVAKQLSAKEVRVLLASANAMLASEETQQEEVAREALNEHMGSFGVRSLDVKVNWLKAGAVAAGIYACPGSIAFGWKIGALACSSAWFLESELLEVDRMRLHEAVIDGDEKLVRELIEDGFPTVMDAQGRTPLEIAIINSNSEIVKLFLSGLGEKELSKAEAFAIRVNSAAIANIIRDEKTRQYENSIVHEWPLPDQKVVKILRERDKLRFEVIEVDGSRFRGDLTEKGMNSVSIEDRIANYKQQRPVFKAGGRVEFSSEYPSVLDKNVTIDFLNGAVTLVDTGESMTTDPTSWGGHACLVIETVENGKRKIEKAHLTGSKTLRRLFSGCVGKVKTRDYSSDIDTPNLLKIIKGKSCTFLKPREEIAKLTKAIAAELERDIPFDIRGSDPHLCGRSLNLGLFRLHLFGPLARRLGLLGLNEEVDGPDNCMTWARKKLRLISIHMPVVISSVAARPKDYVNSLT